LQNRPPAEVFTNALGWLKSIRFTCPNSYIILVVPFGLFEKSAISNAFQQFNVSGNNPAKNEFINLGIEGSYGLTEFVNGGTLDSCDGIHPIVWRSGQLGSLLTEQITLVLNVPLSARSKLSKVRNPWNTLGLASGYKSTSKE